MKSDVAGKQTAGNYRRAKVKNPPLDKSPEILTPGFFEKVRVRFEESPPQEAFVGSFSCFTMENRQK